MRTPASRKPARRAQGPRAQHSPGWPTASRWVGPSRSVSPSGELGSAPSVPVFKHLFDSISRPLDNFPRRYAVHYRLVQTPNNSRYKRHVGATARRQPITPAPHVHVLPAALADAVLRAFPATSDDWAARMPVRLLFYTSVPGSLFPPSTAAAHWARGPRACAAKFTDRSSYWFAPES